MKTLILCRHAKSEYPFGVADFDRPLKTRGIEDAQNQGALLAAHGIMPDLIVSSPALRAITTAKLVAEKIGYTKDIQLESDIYNTHVGDLVSLIQQLPKEAETVMIFGHNPVMSDTIARLGKLQEGYDMPTCAMACIEGMMANWKSFHIGSKLRWLLVPRLLRKGDDE